jgi:hypothetical protein
LGRGLTGPETLFWFLPEVTLACMITYLIGAVAVELSKNIAPKIIALGC